MRKRSAMIGLAIGDALGQPFEFCNHKMIANSNWQGEYQGGAACGVALQPGQWTDDTKMAICVCRSLFVNGVGFDLQRLASEYVKWYQSGDLRGIGIQTQRALSKIDLSESSLKTCGKIERRGFKYKNNDYCGNGTAMRVAPIGVFFRNDPVSSIKCARADATLTHDHDDARDASVAVAYISGLLANEIKPLEAVQETIAFLPDGHVKEKLVQAEKLAFESKRWDDAIVMGPSGTAHETVGTAAFCLLRYCDDSFKSVVCNAVRMGGDTDTRGAIAGAWAGLYHGLDDIPEEYIEDLEHKDLLIALDSLLMAGPEKVSQER